MMVYVNSFLLKAKLAAKKLFTDERGDVNVVSIVVLIAVAVMLAILLKDQISTLIRNLITSITGKANSILE